MFLTVRALFLQFFKTSLPFPYETKFYERENMTPELFKQENRIYTFFFAEGAFSALN